MMRLIDADALSARMYHDVFETDSDMQKWDSGCWIRYKMFERAIENAPTIEPERKKGRWIDIDDHVMCSCCGATHYGADKNFCPNCGTDNRGDHDDNT